MFARQLDFLPISFLDHSCLLVCLFFFFFFVCLSICLSVCLLICQFSFPLARFVCLLSWFWVNCLADCASFACFILRLCALGLFCPCCLLYVILIPGYDPRIGVAFAHSSVAAGRDETGGKGLRPPPPHPRHAHLLRWTESSRRRFGASSRGWCSGTSTDGLLLSSQLSVVILSPVIPLFCYPSLPVVIIFCYTSLLLTFSAFFLNINFSFNYYGITPISWTRRSTTRKRVIWVDLVPSRAKLRSKSKLITRAKSIVPGEGSVGEGIEGQSNTRNIRVKSRVW